MRPAVRPSPGRRCRRTGRGPAMDGTNASTGVPSSSATTGSSRAPAAPAPASSCGVDTMLELPERGGQPLPQLGPHDSTGDAHGVDGGLEAHVDRRVRRRRRSDWSSATMRSVSRSRSSIVRRWPARIRAVTSGSRAAAPPAPPRAAGRGPAAAARPPRPQLVDGVGPIAGTRSTWEGTRMPPS